MAMIILSLIIVVAGYTLIEHGFDLFLYPDRELSERIYAAVSLPLATFEVLVMILTATIVVGWIATYYAAANGRAHRGSDASPLRLAFYSLISREFYVADVYAWLTQATLGLSRRLNVWSRWV